jgi:putative transposase
VNHSREKRREGYTWQRRYWAHLIVDEADYERHIDYLHFNPVKHGLVENVEEWEWSSFNRYKNLGWYAKGLKDPSIGQIRLMEQWE